MDPYKAQTSSQRNTRKDLSIKKYILKFGANKLSLLELPRSKVRPMGKLANWPGTCNLFHYIIYY